MVQIGDFFFFFFPCSRFTSTPLSAGPQCSATRHDLREWIEILVHETPPLEQTPGEALDLLLNPFNNLI